MDADAEMAAWHNAEELKHQEDEMMEAQNLREYDFGDRIREKNGLSYVSWADIWDVVLQIDPDADYEVKQFPHPQDHELMVPYQTLGIGAMVWVALTLKGKTRTAYLPVMDYKNKTVTSPTATDINNSIQRCLSKAAAMHGLSLYVYRGEDVSPALDKAREEERSEHQQAVTQEWSEKLSEAADQGVAAFRDAWKAVPKEARQAFDKAVIDAWRKSAQSADSQDEVSA